MSIKQKTEGKRNQLICGGISKAGAADEVAHAKRGMMATVQPLAKDAAVAAGLKSALRLQNVQCSVRDLSCYAAAGAKMKKQTEV